ncbi:MAG TPA: caspase family protein [Candidatus Marinimicrobia bacterium]|nr:caspase family protein [Candidatus Neomarinimicrobiota bacterium]
MRIITVMLFSLLSWANLSAQGTKKVEWTKTFGGSEWDVGKSILVLKEGGFLIAGYTYSESTKSDGWIIKLDVTGKKVWEKKFGGSKTDCFYGITPDNNGSFVAVGYTESKGAGNMDAWAVKINAFGEKEWEKTYGEYGEEKAYAIDHTTDGGYVITGYNKTKGNRNGLVWILKLDGQGTLEWEKAYGGERGGGIPTDVGNAIISNASGYMVAAHTRSFGAGDEDIWILKLDLKGDTLWTKTFGGTKEEKAFDIAKTTNGYLIAGYTESKGAGSEDIWLLCIDEDGRLLWDKTYGGHSNEQSYAISPLDEGEYSLAGFSHSKGPEHSGLWIFGIDKDHNMQWETTFEGYSGNDKIYCIAPTPDGGLAAVGEAWTEGVKSELWVCKFEGKLMQSINWYVKEKITPWMQQGEFEKTTDYQKRISGINMKKVKDKYLKEATNYYGSKTINLKEASLSRYDANNETFGVSFPNFDKINIAVSINDAQIFKQNWEYVTFENPIFALKGDKLVLEKVVLKINGMTYDFNQPKPTDKSQELKFILSSKQADPGMMRGSGDPLKGLNIAKAEHITPGKYYALIIGIDDYKGQWNPLNNAVNDARAIENLLKNKYQFTHFRTLFNEEATRENIINQFLWLVENVKENDNVFIYYSGHGEFEKKLNKGYWVPVDAQTNSISIYLSNSDIQTFLASIKSKHTLMVSDACFSGDIFRGKTISLPFENSEKYYKSIYQLKSCQAISSGGIEPVMDGGKDGHSVFAYYFIKALNENHDNYLDASRLFERIKIPIVNNSDQSPKFQPVKNTGDEGGQFIFIRK